MMTTKIYISNTVFHLIDTPHADSSNPQGAFLVLHPDADELKQWVQRASKSEISGNVFIISDDVALILGGIRSYFTPISAAGGLVQDGNRHNLMIFRHGHWDLPKGKVETDELVPTAATREVKEECGITELSIVRELAPTYHTYLAGGIHYFKHTHWYLMQAPSQPTTPQSEEGIARAVWMTSGEIEKIIEEAYPSVVDVLANAGVVQR